MTPVFHVPGNVSKVHQQGILGVFSSLVHVSELSRQYSLDRDREGRVASRQRVIVIEISLFLLC